jgi:hypothetical protein
VELKELRERAHQEADELGPEPVDAHARALWLDERRGAVVLLAALVDNDPVPLRRAALEIAEDLSNPLARTLLLEAADTECGAK